MDPAAEHVYTPSELNREVKLHLEMGFPRVLVEAEISNLSRPASGHLYFSLKDDKAQLRCAMFRSAAGRSRVRPENGMKVLARGRVSLYEARGDFQMIVDGLEDAGEGLLQRRFEELKQKLEAEGLFDPARKLDLPSCPSRIALVTSPSGAAVRDLLHVLQRRWPVARIRIYPVPVQGVEAPQAICYAIDAANRHDWAEILIVGRGGGSLEDLMAFNDESVARAVSRSSIPVISAVGHETDFTICDFVADLRAPTPSAAAELAAPDQAVFKLAFARAGRQLHRRISDRLHQESQRLDHLAHRLRQRHPARQLSEQSRQLNSLASSLTSGMKQDVKERRLQLTHLQLRLSAQSPDRKLAELSNRVDWALAAFQRLASAAVESRHLKLAQLARTLNAVSPLETIARGYAVASDTETGELISSVSQITPGDRVTTRLADGSFDSTVDSVKKF